MIARETDGVRDVIDQIHVDEAAATAGVVRPDTNVDDRAASSGAQRRGGDEGGEPRGGSRRPVRLADSAGAAFTDAAITSAVKAKFLADTTVKGLRFDVDTSNGMVTLLNGNVSSRAEADRAMTLARDTDGVKTVHNNLKVGG